MGLLLLLVRLGEPGLTEACFRPEEPKKTSPVPLILLDPPAFGFLTTAAESGNPCDRRPDPLFPCLDLDLDFDFPDFLFLQTVFLPRLLPLVPGS